MYVIYACTKYLREAEQFLLILFNNRFACCSALCETPITKETTDELVVVGIGSRAVRTLKIFGTRRNCREVGGSMKKNERVYRFL